MSNKNEIGVKMPISEIADRYSIAILKNERACANNLDEIMFLNQELNKYEGILEYINKLKDINGKIWDLESDIRKGKEVELGLEEIGRRALKIRDFNKIRVGYKNEMVKRYGEGFEDIKMNHGSSQDKVVISLTTVPERLNQIEEDGLKLVITSLCSQNYSNYEVHFNIPFKYNITGEEYIIPSWINEIEIKYKHLKIFRVEDIGPPTKVVPTILREDDDTLLLVVDDDLVYHPDMINEHLKYHEKLPNSVILYDGRSLVTPIYGDLRDSWVLTVKETLQVKELQHYKSASYFKKYFSDDFFSDFLGKTKSDDVLMSFYFAYKGIPLYVVPYEPEISKVQTYEEWHSYQGVTTFPVIRHSNSVMETGCNHPEMIKKECRFFVPNEFKTIDYMLNINKNLNSTIITPQIKNDDNTSIQDKIFEIIEKFKKIPKKYWDKLSISGDECTFERSKPAPYIRAAIEIANLLKMKTVVEIGATRYGITQKCIDYFYGEENYFVSPPCCSDGHGGIFWTLEGFDVHSVDIDDNCKINAVWSFDVFNKPVPSNLHLHIPKDGIEFLTEFNEKIDVLFLDGWDVGTYEYKEKHLESFEIAKTKLSDIHLILIDDTDYILENEGKDALLTPMLMSLGYTLIFEGRQKLFINKKINEL